MELSRWIKMTTLLFLFAFATCREPKVKPRHKVQLPIYDPTLTKTMVEYASAVYMSDLTELFYWTCSRCDGLTKGFEMIELIVDVRHCLQAFVGVAKNLNATVIAFRGTQESRSAVTWAPYCTPSELGLRSILEQLDLKYPGMDDAMVHQGFYTAYHNTTLRPAILSSIQRVKELYGDIQVMVTGHSMGGAMAAFCGLDLTVNLGIPNIHVTTLGQPRIGNAAFASCYSRLVPNTIRVTNDHDIVPHLPPYYTRFPQKTYHHFPREVWLYNIGIGSFVLRVEKLCDDSGEDPSCSRSVSGNSITDHLEYYGVRLGCDDDRPCKIVLEPHLAPFATQDLEGNFVLSRNLSAPVLKMNGESTHFTSPM